jgi:hypothetical protein
VGLGVQGSLGRVGFAKQVGTEWDSPSGPIGPLVIEWALSKASCGCAGLLSSHVHFTQEQQMIGRMRVGLEGMTSGDGK